MRVAYFDCFSGISGDMILGALLDLGLAETTLRDELNKLSLVGYELSCYPESRMEVAGSRVKVLSKEQDTDNRTFSDIRRLIEASTLDDGVKELSIKVFSRLAEVEAKIHKKDIENIHFHEVGALDSIVDIVGSVAGIIHLGIDRIYTSKLPLGSGFVKCQHGTLPLPAPATLELLRDKPVYEGGIEGELVTPTGAAIITTLADEFGKMPHMRIERIGYGVGDRQFKEIPNLLRVILGEMERGKVTDRVTVIETNIDDMNPEVYDFLMERLFEEGALDISLSALQMKKNRPGVLLKVICREEDRPGVINIILEESTSLGVRFHEVERLKVVRRLEEVETKFGKVRVKIFNDDETKIDVSPEYDDCKRIAKERKVPLRKVYREVISQTLLSEREKNH